MRLRTNGRRLLVQQLRKSQFLTLISSTTPHHRFTTLRVDVKDSPSNSTYTDTYFITIDEGIKCEVSRLKR